MLRMIQEDIKEVGRVKQIILKRGRSEKAFEILHRPDGKIYIILGK